MTETQAENGNGVRIPTGVAGLDEILDGGLPSGRVYLIQGEPGVGKTTLAMQFLLEGVSRNESCVYVCLSESRAEIEGVAESHGWDISGINIVDTSPLAAGIAGDDDNTLFHPSEVELSERMNQLMNIIRETSPKRVVFDSLSEVRLLAENPLNYRKQILILKQFFTGRGITVLLLDDSKKSLGDRHLETIAHGVFELEQIPPLYGPYRRRIRIVKLRGVNFSGGFHDYQLARGGLTVYPRLIASGHRATYDQSLLASGLESLDALLGGGIVRGTSTLAMGPAGSGKSAITTQFVFAAAQRGEHCSLFAFDESRRTALHRAAGLGMDLQPFIDTGLVDVTPVDPAELTPGQFSQLVRKSVEERGSSIVVIDSLNGYLNATLDERALLVQLHELLSYLGHKEVSTFLVVSQHGFIGNQMQTPIDISYLADTLLLLRYFEYFGEVRKAISVVKKRNGPHESTIRELRLSSSGVTLGEPLRNLRGVLQGVPNVAGEALAFESP